MNYHFIEARIRYLTTAEGGRQSGVANGYRGQFHYDGDDHDGFQYFPDFQSAVVELGNEVRAFVLFRMDRWLQVHRNKLHSGKTFQIREGRKVVGEGVVVHPNVPPIESAFAAGKN